MMSTPAATRVESVRENRAIVTFSTTSPIFIGSFSFTASQWRRPVSVFRNFFSPKMPMIVPGGKRRTRSP